MDGPLHDRIRQLRGDGKHRKTRTGKVTSIREHYSNKDMASLELEDEEKPPKPTGTKKGAVTPDVDYRRRFDVEVPKHHTKGLQLGDRVHVHTMIEKA